MAIELRVTSVTALVTGEPRERQVYQGQGDARRVVGRFTDADGRPLSAVSALVIAEPIGVVDNASVLLPDLQLAGMEPGTAIRLEGELDLVLKGKEFSVITAELTAERMTPLGSWVEWVKAGAAGKKPTEARAA